jgi:plasmid stabilization system protein ParE
MPRVVISAGGQADIKRLHRFLAARSPEAALRAVKAIRQSFKPLRTQPEIGRPIEDLPNLRELIIEFGSSGYLALYRYSASDDVVFILTIKHQREDEYLPSQA